MCTRSETRVPAGVVLSSFISLLFFWPLPAHAQCTEAAPCFTAPTNLGTLGGSFSAANAVNADGSVVVGQSLTTGDTTILAFRWTSAGMANLGTLGGSASAAYGVSADGNVVAGVAFTAGDIETHAFRWTSAGMADLGTLGGSYSAAYAISANGSVVVGEAAVTGDLATHAFRWTGGVMTDLGTLGGQNSVALGVNADGTVVVGTSEVKGKAANFHAFRWTSAGMVDLGTLGGSLSTAYAVNADGNVVVGDSSTKGKLEFHAFRWTSAGMVDLGTLGGPNSTARAVSADGSVIVGDADLPCACAHAFRWTAATGMKDLNTLLASAGVNMTGITLWAASGVSANGQFIVGQGDFPGKTDQAFIVRYYDNSPAENPIAGVTTVSSVQNSINDLADTRLAVMAQQQGFAAPLLGFNTPMGKGSEAGVFVTAGSAAGGGFARYSTGNGFALLAGLSYAQETYPDADLRHAGMGALALQYIYNGPGWWRPFLEGGGWYAPHASLDFSRTYANGAGLATGVGRTSADLSYVYARAGLLFAINQADQLAISTEIGRERMNVNAYAEPLTQGNPFEAHIAEGADSTGVAKLRLQWSHRFSPSFDGTLWAAAVRGFNRTTELTAMVPGIGVLQPVGLDDLTWAEYGARIGYKLTDATTLDVFANGVTGGGGIDTRIHTGVGLRFQF